MSERSTTERFAQQAAQYTVPYHWLPSTDQGYWNISRALGWGLEYLAVLETTKSLVLSAAVRSPVAALPRRALTDRVDRIASRMNDCAFALGQIR
jgi:hypothetical protein